MSYVEVEVGIQSVPTPPYATLKQVPELNPELTASSARKLIVVAAIMTADGKLKQILVKKTPDSLLNAPLTEALRNWTFQPAQVDGKPVALKILSAFAWPPTEASTRTIAQTTGAT